jgi:hypothetical protein
MTKLLAWDEPPRTEDPAKRAEWYGGGIPGAYAPNMDKEWQVRWKAKMRGQRSHDLLELRVEIRKTVICQGAVQVLIVVYAHGGVMQSMNGKAGFSAAEWAQMHTAVMEALWAMEAFKAQRAHEQLGSKMEAEGSVERG